MLTGASFGNAIRIVLATGGSTNADAAHPAIAHDAGIALGLDDFDRLSRETPLLGSLRPAGPHTITDLHAAGGVPALLKALAPLLHLDLPTVGRETLRQRVDRDGDQRDGTDVIHTLDDPLSPEGGHRRAARHPGAQGAAVIKPSGVFPPECGSTPAPPVFRERGGVFECEEELADSLLGGADPAGGCAGDPQRRPRGGPGMRELSIPAAILVGMGLGRVGGDGHGWALLRSDAWPLRRPRGAGGSGRRADRHAPATAT